jgi:hypothetical protein
MRTHTHANTRVPFSRITSINSFHFIYFTYVIRNGLLPSSIYVFRIVAYGGGDAADACTHTHTHSSSSPLISHSRNGLLPSSIYVFRIVAYGGGDEAPGPTSPPVETAVATATVAAAVVADANDDEDDNMSVTSRGIVVTDVADIADDGAAAPVSQNPLKSHTPPQPPLSAVVDASATAPTPKPTPPPPPPPPATPAIDAAATTDHSVLVR